MSAVAEIQRPLGTVALRKARRVDGHQLAFRDATPEDAEFILRLRLDDLKSRHLSVVSDSLEAQQAWLRRYQADCSQAYFIVVSRDDARPVGTVRLYDSKGLSFCWGSWIRTDDAPVGFALESALMVYAFGRALGFEASHFDVRIANERVWSLHERLGARRTGSTDQDYFYVMDLAAIERFLQAHARRLPQGIQIDFA